jgi:predicted nucleic acid-binding protein
MSKQTVTNSFVYFDTAPLVQLYLYQAKLTEQAQQVFTTANQVVVSYLCLPEFAGAIRGAVQGKGLQKNVARRITEDFREAWESFLVLEMLPPVFERAAELATNYRVKASDALHLATFETFKVATPEARFFTTDIQQYRVAEILYSSETLPVVWQ